MNALNINALQERIDRYLQAAEVVTSGTSADAIHDFRIASRSVLALEPLLHTTGKTGKWRKPMQAWLKALNSLRDLQVMQERLGKQPEVDKQLRKNIAAELAEWEKLRPAIADKAFRKHLQNSVEQFCQRCTAHPGYFAVTALTLWWDRLEKVQTRFAAIDPQQASSLHRLRVAFKSLRYLANTLRSIGVIPIEATNGLKYWHDLLGDIQDRQVAEDWLERKHIEWGLPQQQAAESASLQEQFLAQQAQFQILLTQLDATVTYSLSGMLTAGNG